MHQTTVRFSVDLWEDLEAEARRLGVSIAQFVREAALARLAYSAGRRGEYSIGGSPADAPVVSAQEVGPAVAAPTASGGTQDSWSFQATKAEEAVERAEGHLESSTALLAQGERARARAREVREWWEGRRAPPRSDAGEEPEEPTIQAPLEERDERS